MFRGEFFCCCFAVAGKHATMVVGILRSVIQRGTNDTELLLQLLLLATTSKQETNAVGFAACCGGSRVAAAARGWLMISFERAERRMI